MIKLELTDQFDDTIEFVVEDDVLEITAAEDHPSGTQQATIELTYDQAHTLVRWLQSALARGDA